MEGAAFFLNFFIKREVEVKSKLNYERQARQSPENMTKLGTVI